LGFIYTKKWVGGRGRMDKAICDVFESLEVSSAHQDCINLIKNTVKQQYCEILLQI